MSVAPVNIQLSSVPSTVSTSPGAATLTQAPALSSSSSINQSHNLPSNTSSTATNSTALSPTSGINGSDPRPWFRPPWRRFQRVCFLLAKGFFAIAGAVVTYLALSTAMWSSAKDYRDDCRSQNETYGSVSQACTSVLHAVLSRPLGLSMFISKSDEDRQRLVRKDQPPVHSTSDDDAVSVAEAFMVIAGMCITGIFLTFFRPRAPAIKASIAGEPNQDLTLNQHSTTTYTAWVDSSVPRSVVTLDIPSLGAGPTNIRRRHTRNTDGSIRPNEEEDCDWLPAGICATDPETQQASDLKLETSDDGDDDTGSGSHDYPLWRQLDNIHRTKVVQMTQSDVLQPSSAQIVWDPDSMGPRR